jgi:hypothetical protein
LDQQTFSADFALGVKALLLQPGTIDRISGDEHEEEQEHGTETFGEKSRETVDVRMVLASTKERERR